MKKNNSKKFGDYIITNPGSIRVIASKALEEGKAVRNTETKDVFMNPIDYGQVILEMNGGDYSELFQSMGLNDDSIEAACRWATRIVNKSIDEAFYIGSESSLNSLGPEIF